MLTIQIDTRQPDWLAVSFPGPPDREDPIGNDLIREVPGRPAYSGLVGPRKHPDRHALHACNSGQNQHHQITVG